MTRGKIQMSIPEEHVHIERSASDNLDEISRKLRNLASTDVSSGAPAYTKQGDVVSVRLTPRSETKKELAEK